MRRKTVLVIAGPTAVGKTAVAIDVAARVNTEIVSADSRQCYRGMSIGTAQPTPLELTQVPHHFIDCFAVDQSLSAADYERLSLEYLAHIFEHEDVAIVCGGTGLYIKALCEGLDEMPPIDPIIAQQVDASFEEKGIRWLKETLLKEDPVFFGIGEIDNPARMLRALIFKRSVGMSIHAFRSGHKKQRPFNIVKVGLEMPRAQLYERIDLRVEIMMANGLLDEVLKLYPFRQLKNLQTVGYAELFGYLDGKIELQKAIELIKQHSRNYAKRQMTWFKKDQDFNWFDVNSSTVVEEILALIT
jgi:tRNA dimethylallyltransferase